VNGPTIEAGESESDGIDCTAGQLVRITMPPDWDGEGPLTFMFSSDNVFYNEMYGIDGFAVTLPVVVPGAGVILPGNMGRAIAWLKIRSGTKGDPITQREARNFAVALLVPDAAPAARAAPKRKAAAKKPAKKKSRR